jgi:hypothetical protein
MPASTVLSEESVNGAIGCLGWMSQQLDRGLNSALINTTPVAKTSMALAGKVSNIGFSI